MQFTILIPHDGKIQEINVQPKAPPGPFTGWRVVVTIKSLTAEKSFDLLKVESSFWSFLSSLAIYFWSGEQVFSFTSESVAFALKHKTQLRPFIESVREQIARIKEVSHENVA